jgi:hypothetical protein
MPFEARRRDITMLNLDIVLGWVIKATSALLLAKRISMLYVVVWALGLVWREWRRKNFLRPSGCDPRTFQPVANRYYRLRYLGSQIFIGVDEN